MKISGKIVDNKNLEKSLDVKNTKKSEKIINKQVSNTAGVDKKDIKEGAKVSLSEKAKEFQKIKEAVSEIPDVDKAKVAKLKEALKDGKLEINYDKLAERIVEHDILFDLLS